MSAPLVVWFVYYWAKKFRIWVFHPKTASDREWDETEKDLFFGECDVIHKNRRNSELQYKSSFSEYLVAAEWLFFSHIIQIVPLEKNCLNSNTSIILY